MNLLIFLAALMSTAAVRIPDRSDAGAAAAATITLFTRDGLSEGQVIHPGDLSGASAVSTAILVTSWLAEELTEHVYGAYDDLIESLLVKQVEQVFVVSEAPTGRQLRPSHPPNVDEAIQQVVDLTNDLASLGVATEGLHMFGHFLGAHIVGIAAKKIEGTFGRITGLNPVRPLPGMTAEFVLDSSDAAFVDMIYTSEGERRHPDNKRSLATIGHVDFIINGGTQQPGCEQEKRHISPPHSKPDELDVCSIFRAVELYAAALDAGDDAVAYACDNYALFQNGNCLENDENLFGPNVNTTISGTFYMLTAASDPFFVDHLKVSFNTAKPVEKYQVKIKVSGAGIKPFKQNIVTEGMDTGNSATEMIVVPMGTNLDDLKIKMKYVPQKIIQYLFPLQVTDFKLQKIQTVKGLWIKMRIKCIIYLYISFTLYLFMPYHPYFCHYG